MAGLVGIKVGIVSYRLPVIRLAHLGLHHGDTYHESSSSADTAHGGYEGSEFHTLQEQYYHRHQLVAFAHVLFCLDHS